MNDADTPARRKKGLRALAALLGDVTAPVRRKRGRVPAALFARWRDVVGADLASLSCPEKYTRIGETGTLVVRVDGPVALEIQHLQPLLIERLNAFLGYAAVHKIALRHGGTTAVHEPAPTRASYGAPNPSRAVSLEAALAGFHDGVRRHAARASAASPPHSGDKLHV